MLRASVIIPTCNKRSRLTLTLWALSHQQLGDDAYEVIIVDDGSAQQTVADLLPPDRPSWQYLRAGGQGRAATRNTGIRVARAPVLIFLDDDILVRPDFIAQHLVLHNTSEPRAVHGALRELPYLRYMADPQTGALVEAAAERTSLATLAETRLSIAELEADFDGVLARQRPRRSVLEQAAHQLLAQPRPQIGPWLACAGANLSLPRSILDHIGCFDEAFGSTWGCEDLELGYRIAQQNYPIVAAEQAIGYHMTHYRAEPFAEHSISHDYFYRKHPSPAVKHLQPFLDGRLPSLQAYLAAIDAEIAGSDDEPVA